MSGDSPAVPVHRVKALCLIKLMAGKGYGEFSVGKQQSRPHRGHDSSRWIATQIRACVSAIPLQRSQRPVGYPREIFGAPVSVLLKAASLHSGTYFCCILKVRQIIFQGLPGKRSALGITAASRGS